MSSLMLPAGRQLSVARTQIFGYQNLTGLGQAGADTG